MKLQYKHFCLIIVLIVSGISCKKYLDVVPPDVGTLDYAFRSRNEAQTYLFTCYSDLQQLNDLNRSPGFTTSSELIFPLNLTSNPFDVTGFSLITGTQSSGNPGLNYWDGSGNGIAMFQAIRRCNTMLENIDKPLDLTAPEKKRWIAETKFLKAYYNYYLLRLYGPIPIIDVNLPVEASTSAVKVKRAPVDDVVKYITGLLDAAIPDLPVTIDNPAKELGRITQPAAMAIKAEVLMTAASPLFNGNPDYANFKDKSGVALFPTKFDATKWQAAATACKAAIDACEAANLKVNTDFTPAGNVSNLPDSLRLVLTFQNALTQKWDSNLELIWALNNIWHGQEYCIPRMTDKANQNDGQNPGYYAVPISTTELFYTHNGVPIDEDNTWDYANRNQLRIGDAANYWYIKQGYTTVKANFDREPRFYGSLGFDGGIWFGNGRDNAKDPSNPLHDVEARGVFSISGPKSIQKTNITGYWPKKLANYQTVYDDGFSWVDFSMPVMRMAGLYLLYAEALNEVSGPGAEAYQYIDKVRARAGLGGVLSSWATYSKNPSKPTTQDGLRAIIHQERRIELCFEGQSGWDLHRWKELQSVLSVPLKGWSIYEEQAVNYYRPVNIEIPVFQTRDYLWPISTNSLVVNDNLVQNPFW
ncbi:RagB/SusD family nutrient uptake outer membrane protein [Mucilaginibacter sp. BJC16-A38]|uniref:RagB/SusD family nutrient uptake outer membrane protein n=1 Tax=Mucilaginibacter phenanthrenivorans TaxID=1234842 RepID=UPI002157FBBF|nr:RagB/SusD family nutrient uptake outer membrane protein [Mucilaginibacter phenanthrenivorans]MCR8560642.1 RagB/SusD family nutrient uptake outer membrane protein [Mucilaginibacter phenanthrenivorans]